MFFSGLQGGQAPRAFRSPPELLQEPPGAVVLKATIIFLAALGWATSALCVWVQLGIICAPPLLFLSFETLSLQPKAFVTLLISVTKTARQKPITGREADF